MKTGRNDPCPCGSGKKYKRCCLSKPAGSPKTLDYRRFSKAFDNVLPRLIEHGVSVFGKKAPELALAEFFGWPDLDEVPDEDALKRADALFWQWFVFNWEYEFDEDERLDGPEETTIAELFLASKKVAPQSPEFRLIRAVNRVPYSFLEVLAVDPGRSVTVRDLLTGVETIVEEHTGSKMLKPEHILFGRAVMVGPVGMFLGLSAFVLPLRVKPQIIHLRRFLSSRTGMVTADLLYEFDLEIREVFLKIDRALHFRPQMQNTDGDPLEFHRLVYDIASADQAVEKLAALCRTETVAAIRAGATRDRDGGIVKAAFDWERPAKPGRQAMGATVLGNIEIDGRRMTVSVNSAARAASIKKKIARCLGAGARLRMDEISDLDAMLDQGRGDDARGTGPHSGAQMMAAPELEQHVANLLRAHWQDWTDHAVPALGGQTPRQAVRTSDGRESVQALLREAEQLTVRDPIRSVIEPDMIADVRRRLGLDRPPGDPGGSSQPTASAALDRIKTLVAGFGQQRLNETYTGYALALCEAAAACPDLNLHRGRTEIWAAAIVYAIARLNFLFSPETPNHLTVDELCRWFEVKKTTAGAKADKIRAALELFHDDARFCAPHITGLFRFVEDAQGFIHPAANLPAGGDDASQPPPLKAPQGPAAVTVKAKAAPVKPGKTAPELHDGRQQKLFED